MGISVTVHDQSATGRAGGSIELEGISAAITLRDLIRTRVREELARAPEPRGREWEEHADRAIEAFGRNGFFVLVDDRQASELDAPLDLTADSDIRFVRLVPLVGG